MNEFLSCEGCDTAVLGGITVEQDCTNYAQKYSQVAGIIIVPVFASLPDDWTDADDWADVISNTDAGLRSGKYLVGEGELLAPEKVFGQYGKRDRVLLLKDYELSLSIKNLSDEQYDFLRQLQCGFTAFSFWIETVGNRLIGGEGGIDPRRVDVFFPQGGGRNDKELARLVINYDSDGDPPRTTVDLAPAMNVITATVFGPVAGGDEAFGPVAGGDEAFGYLN